MTTMLTSYIAIIIICLIALLVIYLRRRCMKKKDGISKYLIYTSFSSPEVYIIPPKECLKSEAKFFKTNGTKGRRPLHKGPYPSIEDAYQAIKKYEAEIE